jgi:transcriptional antiterminator RfaH
MVATLDEPDVHDGLRWYVVQTKPKQEARAELNLRSWNVEILAPKILEWQHSPNGGRQRRPAPLFPGYLLARFDAKALVTKIRLTRGIRRVVGFGQYATPLEDGVVSLIQSRIGDDGFVHPPRPKVGDLVQIADGPFRSLVGIFERELPARDRVVILLNAVGCPRVQVARADIENVPTAARAPNFNRA